MAPGLVASTGQILLINAGSRQHSSGVIIVKIFKSSPILTTIELLSGAKLPSSDLTVAALENVFGCGDQETPDGIVGLEFRGKYPRACPYGAIVMQKATAES
jgi:hypothetical protein